MIDHHGQPGDSWDRSILGIDNVPLELEVASAGTRVLATFIDLLLVYLLMAVVVVGFALSLAAAGLDDASWLFALLGLAIFGLHWGYFAAFEIASAGRTPGKMAIGLRVISRHGGRASNAGVLARNFLRPLDYLFGVALMLFDRRSRRLGDLVGGTLVVRQGAASDEELRLGRVPQGWGAHEVAVVEGFLRRYEALEQPTAEHLARRLASWVEGLEPALAEELADEPRPIIRLRRLLAVTGG